MLVEYLTGEEGGIEEQVSSAQISRLIIAGDSLAPIVNGKPEGVDDEVEKKSVSFHITIRANAHIFAHSAGTVTTRHHSHHIPL